MSGIKTITLDPDGDLILQLDVVKEVKDAKGDSKDASVSGEGSTTSTSETSKANSDTVDKVHMIVSSKHMCLASPVFKAMLQGRFKEADQLREKGRIEIPLPDDDAAAMEVVARIIHGRFTTIPKIVKLPLFTQITVLVDKYQMLEIVYLNASHWAKALDLREGSHLSWSDRFRWLCISYVLHIKEEFNAITKTICRESDRTVARLIEESDVIDLPIPQFVLAQHHGTDEEIQDAIETMRQQSIQNMIGQLQTLILKYQSSSEACCPLAEVPTYLYNGKPVPGYGKINVHRNECDAMVLGYLIKSAYVQNLYPQPLPPYDSYSLFSVSRGIANLEITTACAKLSGKLDDNHDVLERLHITMSSPKIITVDPDGDLVLMLDPVEEVPKSEHEFQLVTSGEQSDTPTSDIAEPISQTIYKTHLMVSSKHMSLASPVFKAMLQGGFREGEELRGMKKISLPLPDDDTEAMKILIHWVHCKLNSVPVKVNLELFTNIAILVDKYRMHEVLKIMTPIWTKHLEADMMKTWNSVVRWICIAWVFGMHEEFQKATQILHQQSKKHISQRMQEENLSLLPIPEHVLAELEKARQTAIKEGIQLFRNLLDKYKGTKVICTASESISPYLGNLETHRGLCDSMVLGCLMKSYLKLEIFPFAEQPYTGWSIRECYNKAQRLAVTTACFTKTNDIYDNHRICEDLIENLRKMEVAVKGLNLEDLKPKDKE
ncbi:BTB POZ domain-containing protein [Rutstroemia sp. NJR-2017a WRK4]|nr:BTB POZ domain-containing protein [Rutstroemia sp. NJR-2017a WRK4]